MDTVILLHGLYMTGAELVVLRHRLRRVHGFRTRIFRYRSMAAGLAENAERLQAFIAETEGERVHLLGHSLGGVVLLRLLASQPQVAPGRVVCLGSPLKGSSFARVFSRVPLGPQLVGRSMLEALDPVVGADRWSGARDLGVIAGSVHVGMGALLGVVSSPGDGTVSVEETRLPGATDHLVLPVSHGSMLLSAEVADEAAGFFRSGRFPRRASGTAPDVDNMAS